MSVRLGLAHISCGWKEQGGSQARQVFATFGHKWWTGMIKDGDRLKQLFYLFAETLDQLCRMGSAYEKNPGVRL